MCEFFTGWKRKIGCVTLAMASLALIGWVRSFVVVDHIQYPIAKLKIGIITSVNGVLAFGTFTYSNSMPKPPLYRWDSWDGSDARVETQGSLVVIRIPKVSIIVESPQLFSYWSFAVPLALISAWLLLSKRQPTKPAQMVEHSC